MKKKLVIIAMNLALVLAGALLVELGAWILGIRPAAIDPAGNPEAYSSRMPRNYFVANDERGFDIRKSQEKPLLFKFADGTVEIRGNALGCNDRAERFDGPYVLLLGDSFTWGYAPYEAKWGTLLEASLGLATAKCGVVHTGQRHQLSKGREIVAAVGRAPRVVIVQHFLNDSFDDLVFPGSTVIDGNLVNDTTLERGVVVRAPRDVVVARERERVQSQKRPGASRGGVRRWLHERSVILAGLRRVLTGATAKKQLAATGADDFESVDPTQNLAAIAAVKAWTDSIGARLLLVLVPRSEMTKDYYASLRPYLDEHKIDYVDLYASFMTRPDHGKSLHWQHDPHWNVEGNRVVADVIAAEVRRRYPEILAP